MHTHFFYKVSYLKMGNIIGLLIDSLKQLCSNQEIITENYPKLKQKNS